MSQDAEDCHISVIQFLHTEYPCTSSPLRTHSDILSEKVLDFCDPRANAEVKRKLPYDDFFIKTFQSSIIHRPML
jgi:hypothetical protein